MIREYPLITQKILSEKVNIDQSTTGYHIDLFENKKYIERKNTLLIEELIVLA